MKCYILIGLVIFGFSAAADTDFKAYHKKLRHQIDKRNECQSAMLDELIKDDLCPWKNGEPSIDSSNCEKMALAVCKVLWPLPPTPPECVGL